MRSPRRHTALLALLLLACGGGAKPRVTEPPAPKPSLPVLTTLAVVLPQDSIRASLTLAATVRAADEKAREMTVGLIEWISSNPRIAIVTPSGLITAIGAGTAIITARVGSVAGQRTLVVLPPPPGPLPVATVAIDPVALELDIGAANQFAVTLRDFAGAPVTNRDVTWTSSNDSVAIVASDGTVTARTSGTAIIEASSEGQRGACVVAVREAVDASVRITVAQPLAQTEVGDTVTVVASVRSPFALVSVSAMISGTVHPMTAILIQKAELAQELWTVSADVSTIATGPLALVVTAIDAAGKRGIVVVPIVRRPKTAGGGKPASGSK
jgi:Bacterial Ig-like domain (group 2)